MMTWLLDEKVKCLVSALYISTRVVWACCCWDIGNELKISG